MRSRLSVVMTPFLVAISSWPCAAADLPSDIEWTDFTASRTARSLAAGDGALWIGSLGGGVLEYDPAADSFRKFTRVSSCLPTDTINDLAHDPGRRAVWAATDRGLARLTAVEEGESPTWEVFDTDSSPIDSNLITAVEVAGDGVVWVGTFDAGAYAIDTDGEWIHLGPATSGLSDEFVTSIVAAPDGSVWFGVWGDGVDRLADGVWSNFNPANTNDREVPCGGVATPPGDHGLISFFVNVLAADPITGAVWFANDDDGRCRLEGLTRFDGERWATFTRLNSGLVSNSVTAAVVDSGGAVWVGTQEGVSVHDGESWLVFGDEEGLADENVLAAETLESDGTETIWIGSFSGLTRFEGREPRVVRAPGLPDSSVMAVHAASDGSGAWFGTREGISRYRDDVGFVVERRPDFGDVFALESDGVGNLWVGTRLRGAWMFDGGTWLQFNVETSRIASNLVTTIHAARDGSIWFGHSAALSRFADGVWSVMSISDGIPAAELEDIAEAPEGTMWVATRRGVARRDGGGWTVFTEEDGLAANFTTAVEIAPDGKVWVGTFSRGLSRFDGETWRTLTSRDSGFLSDRVRDLELDRRGRLWLATWDGGLSALDPQTGDWMNFTREQGLLNDRVNALSAGPDGRLWVGTDFGATALELPSGTTIRFERGNANGHGNVDIADAAFVLGWLFLGGEEPGCLASADTNGDGSIDLADPISTLEFLFLGGQSPAAPFPGCGQSALGSDRELGCRSTCRD